MKTKIAATLALGLGVSMAAVAQQEHPLVVKFLNDHSCKPKSVGSVGNSCDPDEPDPPDTACRVNNALVHWIPLDRIKDIGKKPGSEGGANLTGCGPNPGLGVYQCTLTGRPGEWVEYYVDGQDLDDPDNRDCRLDPVIRVK